MIFSRHKLSGILALVLFIVLACFELPDKSAKNTILFIVSSVAVAAIVFFVMTSCMSPRGKSWLILLPFVAIALFCRIILGWHILLPFIIVGLCAVGTEITVTFTLKQEMPVKRVLLTIIYIALSLLLWIPEMYLFGITI